MICLILYFPKENFLAKRGKPTEEIHVNQKINLIFMKKNIMPFCFSHMSYLSLGTEVAREGKKQATITAITYMYISYVLMDNNAFLSY